MDLAYDGEPISTTETIERTPNSAGATSPPAPAPKPYVPYDANSSSSLSDGLQATEKFGIACAFLGVCILGLMFMTRRNQRVTRFHEIQMASFDDDALGLT